MIFIIVLLILSLAGIIYYFPLQRVLAEEKFKHYIIQQGISLDDIKNKDVFKDYKQDGYFISVRYQSDPNHRYIYHYFLIERGKNGTLFNTMGCDVYDNANNQLDDYSNVMYEPLVPK
ncbi:DUF3139 domain-containing protein [Paenibacillus massiliensis]|uniref:DUF3139 domain-containing protein n=1 Tax=Paenibacillus massiliensis TaxID=225917 RepID=UPI00046F557A|nr:DUF3139 domain-containing protein [Paenibacillus massiliensis]